jgi:hypothetical protein
VQQHGFDVLAGAEQIGLVIGTRAAIEQLGQGAYLHEVGLAGLRGNLKGAVDDVPAAVLNGGDVFAGAFAPTFNLLLHTKHNGYPSWLMGPGAQHGEK